jgi:putative redox protein
MVHGEIESNFHVCLSDGRHQINSDLALELKGADKGPNPHEILEAALVACTLQTMQMYGSRKGWNLGKTKVGVKFLAEGAEVIIGRTLSFDPHLSQEQKDKLKEIANKCPIHKILHSSSKIETAVV